MMIGPYHNRSFNRGVCMACATLASVAGCAPNARVRLSAANSLDALVVAVERAAGEYHAEIRTADAVRRQMAIDAFVQRIRADHQDELATAGHVARFNEALARVLQDGEIENARFAATLENIRAIREIGVGLRRLAVESMTLDDELRRYVTDLLKPVQAQDTGSTSSNP